MANTLEIRTTDPGFEKVQRDFDALPRSLKEIILRGSEVGQKFEQMRNKAGEAGKAGKNAFAGMRDELLGIAAGMVTLTAVLGTVKKTLDEIDQQRSKNIQDARTEEQALKGLLQYAKGDVKEARRMKESADTTAVAAGVEKKLAYDFQAALENAGLGKSFRDFLPLFDITTPQGALNMVQGASGLDKAFGAEQLGGFRAILNQIIAAANAEGSPANPETFSPAALRASALAAMMGASAQNTMATLSQIAALASNSPDEAATQMDAFAKAAVEQGLKGSFVELARQIQGMGMSDTELQKWFGRVEGIKGYQNILKSIPAIERTEREVLRAKQTTLTPRDTMSATILAIDEGSRDQAGLSITAETRRLRQAEAERLRLQQRKMTEDVADEAQLLEELNADRTGNALRDTIVEKERYFTRWWLGGLSRSGEADFESPRTPDDAAEALRARMGESDVDTWVRRDALKGRNPGPYGIGPVKQAIQQSLMGILEKEGPQGLYRAMIESGLVSPEGGISPAEANVLRGAGVHGADVLTAQERYAPVNGAPNAEFLVLWRDMLRELQLLPEKLAEANRQQPPRPAADLPD